MKVPVRAKCCGYALPLWSLSSASLLCLRSTERDRDAAELPAADSKVDPDGLAAKRRHSRPAELDSEGEEEEADTSEKEEEEEEESSDREEEADIREVAERLLAAKVSQLCQSIYLSVYEDLL